jgi:protein-disulfide isomerase
MTKFADARSPVAEPADPLPAGTPAPDFSLRSSSEEMVAAAVGLDVERFDREMEGQVNTERVRADFMSGVRSGVNGTPTFFINGRRHDGSYDLETLLAAIDAAVPEAAGGTG